MDGPDASNFGTAFGLCCIQIAALLSHFDRQGERPLRKQLVLWAAVAGAGVAFAGGAAAGPEAKKGFDGTWTVLISTETGPCDRTYNYAVAIEGGRVQQASASGGATISGQISPDGNIGLGLRSGPATADASGRLRSGKGSGTWTLAMLGCSGRWTAHKRTIQADAS